VAKRASEPDYDDDDDRDNEGEYFPEDERPQEAYRAEDERPQEAYRAAPKKAFGKGMYSKISLYFELVHEPETPEPDIIPADS